jgi:hypothetical protein
MSEYENYIYCASFMATYMAATALIGWVFISRFENFLMRTGRTRAQAVNICYSASAVVVLASMGGLILFIR